MITANVINHMPDTEKWKKGESDRLLEILEDFVDNFINIYLQKLEENLLHQLTRILESGIRSWNSKRMNTPVKHLLKP